ncbi:GntR family transcriptional regulator [Paraburkholderia caribensis]|uniref:GntR family transcriptional regulator n=1 Tax=Paraburkholderia caribensis TaxID=75105 RepID=UPI0009EC8C77|nr:GntR family transcriptional regulator [Paraburkholderia caribensis]
MERGTNTAHVAYHRLRDAPDGNLRERIGIDGDLVSEHKRGLRVVEYAILQDIVTGAGAPGSKLKIRKLADRYEAGVIPRREAVSPLAMSARVAANRVPQRTNSSRTSV